MVFNPTGLINSFTFFIKTKNHIQKCSNSELLSIQSRWHFCEIGRASSRQFFDCGKFGLTRDIIQDIDALLKKTKKDKSAIDKYLDSFKSTKKVQDLLMVDFIIEIIDRRFTKLFTFERDAKTFLERL